MNRVVVIPTYNESESLRHLLPQLRLLMPDLAILIVDDNSPDGTAAVAEELNATLGGVEVLRRPGKQGLGPAYIAGFQAALNKGFDQIAQMDADLSHDPTILPKMFAALSEVDVAIGSRYVAGGGTLNWGLHRRIISRGGGIYARAVLGLPIQDPTGGYKAWRADVLRAIDLPTVRSTGYLFTIETNYRAVRGGFKTREFPFVFKDRTMGVAKMSASIFFEAFVGVWRIRRYRPSIKS